MADEHSGEWHEWRRAVLGEIERIAETQERGRDQITEMQIELAMLKTRNNVNAAWISAVVSIITALGVTYLRGN